MEMSVHLVVFCVFLVTIDIIAGSPPIITSVGNDGKCDLRTSACDKVKVYGTGFIETGDLLKCKLKSNDTIRNNGGDYIITGNTTENTVVAEYLSPTEINCPITTTSVSLLVVGDAKRTMQNFQLFVSNDGANFSNFKDVLLYDSKCRSCPDTAMETCQIKSDNCERNGHCVNEPNCTDPCYNYETTLSDPRRSTGYQITPQHLTTICDDSINAVQWQRFTSYTGGVMPEHCIPADYCGTNAPIWMNGSHPTAANPGPIEVSVCGNLYPVNPTNLDSQCCDWLETIQVKYCSGIDNDLSYYIYMLKVTPFCDMAYCVGDIVPCDDGFTWNKTANRCEDIDECSSQHPCGTTGTCTNRPGSYTCSCASGQIGLSCPENRCSTSPCTHGTCEDVSPTQYRCVCSGGYTGIHCDVSMTTAVDICVIDPCSNGGTCNSDGQGGFVCQCQGQYTGQYCLDVITTTTKDPVTSISTSQTQLPTTRRQTTPVSASTSPPENTESKKLGSTTIIIVAVVVLWVLVLAVAVTGFVITKKKKKKNKQSDPRSNQSDSNEENGTNSNNRPITPSHLFIADNQSPTSSIKSTDAIIHKESTSQDALTWKQQIKKWKKTFLPPISHNTQSNISSKKEGSENAKTTDSVSAFAIKNEFNPDQPQTSQIRVREKLPPISKNKEPAENIKDPIASNSLHEENGLSKERQLKLDPSPQKNGKLPPLTRDSDESGV